MIPVVSTAGGLAILTAMKGPEAIQKALGGNVVGAINDVAGALNLTVRKASTSQGPQREHSLAKLVLKICPDQLEEWAPLMFTTQ